MTDTSPDTRSDDGTTSAHTADDDAPASLRPIGRSLPMALLRAREAAMRSFRPMLAGYDLTEQQWRVLRVLDAAEPLTVGDIAERACLLGPSLSRILANLEDRGLVARSTSAGDQRRSEIRRSPAGRKLTARVAPRSEAIYAHIESHLGVETLQRILADLTLLDDLPPFPDGPADS